ncbi:MULTISPECIES: alkaline phosphatase D family protein [unclassified Nonomuraea]|uniref:alkaline phosphatase D family protein n=1 Tax=unclassified Nonomuraea TaxID=2593643 RepID=UPI00191BDD46|nr:MULTISPECIES: alkaline phosphatase D family protein [unclassified Nonomuraea]
MTTPHMTSRRRMLAYAAGLAGLAAVAQVPGGWTDSSPALPSSPFTLGVASGDPRPDGVVLWTRLAPQPLADDGLGGMPRSPVPVRWEVAEDDGMRKVVRRGVATARPELAHAVHVEVRGLRPGRVYWYRFTVGSDDSPVGRTKTAPDPRRAVPVSFAFASCQAWDIGFYTAYRDLSGQDLDLVAHLGDYIYENGVAATGGARGTPLSPAHGELVQTLSQYRLRHSLVGTDTDLQAARAAAPWLFTLDDHDVEDNWGADRSPTGATPENFLRRRAAAFRAFYENNPMRPSALPVGPDMAMHHRVGYGRLANFFVLDARQFRSPIDIGARLDPSRTMLGEEQERWLLKELADSSSTWNLLANQVMMFQLDRLTDPGLQQLNPDTWDGYAAARARLWAGIGERRVSNPVVLTGDAHVNCAAELKADFADPDSPSVGVEFVGTSITSGGDGSDSTPGGQEWLAANPHLKFFNNQRGYVRCRADADTLTTDYVVVDKVTTAGGAASVRRSFVVESGRPALQDM